ncbi:hypothetical protein FHW83_001978 [Duganella sp. SG902]|uniref:T6SS immunity protein Tli4 family protein n=1 Tax=Duganella sp. SG902 TaxID=2587016 RepID=UPI00159D92E6|nr:T6SS immunity protein Tli4 family protein [Duganella sp. SG902]NVM76183.1 hypothetical protein [Duganella sp. SG902]
MEHHIAAMKMKTVCVGRFLMDVPEKAMVSYRGATVDGFDISSWVETDEEFLARNTTQEVKLRSEKNEKGQVSLEQVREIKSEYLHGRLFVFNRQWLPSFSNGVKEIEEVITTSAFVRAREVTYKFYSKLQDDAGILELEKLLGQLRWRGEEELPSQPGFCFDRALLVDPLSADVSEITGIFVGLKDPPDLAIALNTFSAANENKPLLQRDAENDIKQAYLNRFHTLREGPRALAGVPGEELLERVDEPNGSVLHGFMWESLRKKNDPARPLMVLELDTGKGQPGKPVNSSLSDTEVLALWDKMSNSLRRHHAL